MREKALEILFRIVKEGAYSNLEIASSLKGLDSRSRAFITRLVYGTVSYKIQADFVIQKHIKKPVEKLDTEVLLILETAFYQHFYMDSVPDYAIINESVNLCRKFKKSSAAGLINAVLRKVFGEKLGFEDLPENTAYYYSIKYSVPKNICSLIIHQYGELAREIISESREIPPLTLRVNTLKISTDELIAKLADKEIKAEKCAVCPDCITVCGGLNVGEDELFTAGYYYPQDEASAMSAYVLDPKPGEFVIDMCAAPGGKTTYMAQLMKNQGKVVAFDLYEHKIQIINDTARRLGIDIITPQACDSTKVRDEYVKAADKIMLDCPCSGYGILRKKPELGMKAQEGGIEEIQYKIMETAAEYLKVGGEMVYSTCTINKKENIENLQRFISNHGEFELCDIEEYFGKYEFKNSGKGYVQILPGEYGMDGFFISKLKKIK